MYQFRLSLTFRLWLAALKDGKAKARILERIRAAEHGNLGDCRPVGEGVSEMRVHIGPGYRLYFKRRGQVMFLLLVGGDKSTQRPGIRLALKMAREVREE